MNRRRPTERLNWVLVLMLAMGAVAWGFIVVGCAHFVRYLRHLN